MKRSMSMRLIIVGVLTLFMFVPLFFASETINSRAQYSRSTIQDVSKEWGGSQNLGGPVLVIPVTAQVTRTRTVDVVDPLTGLVQIDPETKVKVQRVVTETVTEQRPAVYVAAQEYALDVSSTTQVRHRGLFEVPVYQSTAKASFDFKRDGVTSYIATDETLHEEKAEIWYHIGINRALRGQASLVSDGKAINLEPLANGRETRGGLQAVVGKSAFDGTFNLTFGFNGAQKFSVTPSGRTTTVSLASDWPHPSFYGAFLPDDNDVGDDGFSANWMIPHLSLGLPHITRNAQDNTAKQQGEFGVQYFQPNDFYQKAFRAGRYGILFIALTFLSVLLIERRSETPVHPVQYVMIGLAQSLFVVLMVALAEQIGFTKAYAASAAATIGLITAYGFVGLKLGSRTYVLGACLCVIYAILFLILQAQDLALLAGAILSFGALAVAMFGTRNEDWYGGNSGSVKGFLDRVAAKPEPKAAEVQKD